MKLISQKRRKENEKEMLGVSRKRKRSQEVVRVKKWVDFLRFQSNWKKNV